MKRVLLVAIVALGVLMISTLQAQAALQYLKMNVPNQLEDQDWETLVNYDSVNDQYVFPLGDVTVDENDLLTGIIRIQAINTGSPDYLVEEQSFGASPPPDAFTGVFVLEVKTKAAGGIGFQYTFGPAPDAAWTYLGLSRMDSNTMIKWFDDSSDPFVDPVGNGNVDLANLQTVLATPDGTLLWEWGFTAAPDGSNNFFWSAETTDDDITNSVPLIQSGNFQAGLNVTFQSPSAVDLELHDELATAIGYATNGPTQVQLQGGFEGFNQGRVLALATDTNLYIKPVPEPMSLAIWGSLCGIGVLGLGVMRRRRGGLSSGQAGWTPQNRQAIYDIFDRRN